MRLTEVFRMSVMEADTYLAPSSYLGSERKHVHQKTLNPFPWISSSSPPLTQFQYFLGSLSQSIYQVYFQILHHFIRKANINT